MVAWDTHTGRLVGDSAHCCFDLPHGKAGRRMALSSCLLYIGAQVSSLTLPSDFVARNSTDLAAYP